jgi:S-methylmethionine-dependent homocysteine/selenocysteine methylase
MPVSRMSFEEALARRTLLLDGATGTELERRGVPAPLPLWSAGALITHPHVVEAIHRDYVTAGADIVVANTFRTNLRTLRAAGRAEQGEGLNRLAVELARRAAAREGEIPVWEGEAPAEPIPDAEDSTTSTQSTPARRVWIAASVSPVEDCYHPERVPDEPTLQSEHAQMMAWLKASDPDLVWIETMNTVREARAAAQAAAAGDLPFAVSFVVQGSGDLLSGEALEEAVAAVEPFNPLAIGVNCIPPRAVAELLRRLRRSTPRPLSAYAHIGNLEPIRGWSYSQNLSPTEYADCARRWLDEGASIIGGCCGTTPAHIRPLAKRVRQVEGTR